MKYQKGFVPVIVILIALIGIGGIIYLRLSKYRFEQNLLTAPSPTLIPTPVTSPVTNLEIHEIDTYDSCGSKQPRTKFKITVPQGWVMNQRDVDVSQHVYEITRNDEHLTITCGIGFGGGGCPDENIKTLKIAGYDVNSCLMSNNTDLGLSYLKREDNTFSFTASVNSPETINEILSTFKFVE